MTDDEPAPDGPWRGNKLYVLNRKCSTCIFRPGNRMHLREGRVQQMIDDCLADDTVIPCHATLDAARSVCRGFYDRHRRDVMPLRLAHALGLLTFDEPPEGH